MTDSEETAYLQGQRAAWLSVLRKALHELGYDDAKVKAYGWIVEREEAVQKLRELCREHGDNEWPDDLYLADIIENHLADYLDTPDDGVDIHLPDLSSLPA